MPEPILILIRDRDGLDALSREDVEFAVEMLGDLRDRETAGGERRDILNRVVTVLAEHLIDRHD